MGLSPSDVARLAELARVELTEAELAKLAPELDVILDAVASVSAVAAEDIEPTSHSVPLTNVFRADEVRASWPASAMLAMAPAVEDERFRVPQILQEEA